MWRCETQWCLSSSVDLAIVDTSLHVVSLRLHRSCSGAKLDLQKHCVALYTTLLDKPYQCC